LCENPAIFEL